MQCFLPTQGWKAMLTVAIPAIDKHDMTYLAVSKAIEIISKELGNDNWDKDKFRKEWEEKLKSQNGTTSQKSYEELLKERGQELKRRIDEKDFSAEEYKVEKPLTEREKEALEK